MQVCSTRTSRHSCRGIIANSEWISLGHSCDFSINDRVHCATARSALQWAVFHLLPLISYASWRGIWMFAVSDPMQKQFWCRFALTAEGNSRFWHPAETTLAPLTRIIGLTCHSTCHRAAFVLGEKLNGRPRRNMLFRLMGASGLTSRGTIRQQHSQVHTQSPRAQDEELNVSGI